MVARARADPLDNDRRKDLRLELVSWPFEGHLARAGSDESDDQGKGDTDDQQDPSWKEPPVAARGDGVRAAVRSVRQ
jgi:hypothetical protein